MGLGNERRIRFPKTAGSARLSRVSPPRTRKQKLIDLVNRTAGDLLGAFAGIRAVVVVALAEPRDGGTDTWLSTSLCTDHKSAAELEEATEHLLVTMTESNRSIAAEEGYDRGDRESHAFHRSMFCLTHHLDITPCGCTGVAGEGDSKGCKNCGGMGVRGWGE